MAKSSRYLLALAVVIGILGVFWPQLEEAFFHSCPFIFNRAGSNSDSATSSSAGLPKFSKEMLAAFDGSDEAKPIFLAVGGKVLDVTSGKKFYEKGAGYNIFAGTACTRALTIASLEQKDLTDDIANFTPEQVQELHKTLAFYYDKYPVVGVMDYEFTLPPKPES
ncbi:hypothetical protein ACHHYP_09723 [Achlya hypogyna]|uniref:Cytochrome b5 heme-binding domain-containing protein n=1 Tax=Achlya hypogyna TaxID=1202772 RepID=A0A1V9YMK8_ACHHY|nr:hypothetical protein ACHHYP_09723 [Achlya hypogyna]